MITDRKIYTFGSNYDGNLGIGCESDIQFIPTEIKFFNDKSVKQIQSGMQHTLVVTGMSFIGLMDR